MAAPQRFSVALMSFATVLVVAGSPFVTADEATGTVGCTDLATMSWGGFTISEALERPATGGNPAHCRVRGTIDSEIQFELLLPTPHDWNGRFVMGGGGGFVGSVQNQAITYSRPAPSPLQQGFATAGTDTGHQGSGLDASWALDRDDREVNFGHRAVHVTSDAAKAIMRVHYESDVEYSYFLGCSRGGGQAMMSSQRYPDDFDGIVAGAPAYDWPGIGAGFIQTQQAMFPNSEDLSAPVLDQETRSLLENAILDACDDQDGVKDGILGDPRRCAFRTEDLPTCLESGGPGNCVTSEQRAAIDAVYMGAIVDGEQVYPGFPVGGEAAPQGWGSWIAGGANAFGPGTPSLHYAFGTQMYKYLVYDDPDWDYSTYDFSNWESETEHARELLNADDPDLTPFRVAGGKLIMWTGWADPAITPLGTIEYFEAAQEANEDPESFTRMFALPGVLHCAGGPGPDQVDWLGTIQTWVEFGEAPEQVTATRTDAEGNVEMQRPVCAFPATAAYDGSGDPAAEESFECVAS